MSNEPPRGTTPPVPPPVGGAGGATNGPPPQQGTPRPHYQPPQRPAGHNSQGPPPGYPPQAYPPQQFRQPGYSQQQGYAPPPNQGQMGYGHPGQYPPGQPPHGWGPQHQQQGWGTQGPPRKKTNIAMVVALVAGVVALVLAGMLWALTSGNDEAVNQQPSASAQPTPSNDGAQATDPPADPGTETTPATDPPTSKAPPLPSHVADFTATETSFVETGSVTPYLTPDSSEALNVLFVDDPSLADGRALEDETTFGVWRCGTDSGGQESCFSAAHGGTVVLQNYMTSLSVPEFAAWGDELLSLWK